MELTEIKGIGDKTAEKLISLGITSAEDLATLRPEELASMLGINRFKAQEMINDAKEKTIDTAIDFLDLEGFEREIESKRIRYSTGSSAFDEILGGGISTFEITALRGEFGTAKTQTCYSTSISCIKRGRKVAWIETEPSSLVPSRIVEIGRARGLSEEEISKNFISIPARSVKTPAHLFIAYQRIEKEISRGVDIGLIVIDSFSAPFRHMYSTRETLTARSLETARHLGYLQKMCIKYNLAVLITVQVMDIPDESKQLSTRVSEDSAKAMYGGNVLKHAVQTWVTMSKKSRADQIWTASIIDSSYLPPRSAEFMIDSSGVRDIATTRGRVR